MKSIKKTDFFEDIAASFNVVRQNHLSQNPPMRFEKNICKLYKSNFEPIAVPKRMNTKEELYEELIKERKKHEPFLKNYAPEIPNFTKSINIKEFILDDENSITIPCYGGPTGNAEQKYTTEFDIEEELSDKAVYICFGGADYHSSVYINDYCVGTHEGFFSPFEFEITEHIKKGKNTLKIVLKNDYPYMGYENGDGIRTFGDKMYAATGLGWDDPEVGWHHCPPGMGIYNYVRIEIRNRINITDLFVRPILEEKKAEVWVEVENADYIEKPLVFSVSVYGQNFEKEVLKDFTFDPYFCHEHQKVVNKNQRSSNSYSLTAAHGSNIYKIIVDIDDIKIWDIDTPYLYQVQVSVKSNGEIYDMKKQQFGMRSFSQDIESRPKGKFYLNGRNIKLRGANTMGFEQQDVLYRNFEQLIDDILLAKICNMNFWRLTQRPVQDEVLEYCDKLGLMTQTDLPMFDCVRRNKFAEVIRQTEEMAKMVRKHPCNVVISYINEPVPFAWSRPHRNLLRDEMEDMFECCDKIVKLNHPDCVIKHVDGDYDPPTRNSISDNHCYNLWYNGHAIDFGKLYKGYWLDTDTAWCCGCGEFGAEGLDFKDLMQRRYPTEWLKEPFSPANIIKAQAMNKHGSFFDTPTTIDEWIEATQEHQAYVTKTMTECFRRNPNMITYAIHLFIDAWPSGWMKTIMDCERTPKPAYFTYRDACAPLLITLRSDRFTYYENENISIETYISNDIDETYNDYKVAYELYSDDEKVMDTDIRIDIKACDVTYVANAEFSISDVVNRKKYVLRAILINENGEVVSYNEFPFEVFADVAVPENDSIVYIDDLNTGTHEIAGEIISVYDIDMGGLHFVSRDSNHKAVEQFEKNDFKYWYNAKEGMITALTDKIFKADGFTPILVSNNASFKDENGYPEKQCVVAEKMYNGKRYIVSTLDMRCENPIAKRFKKAIYEL